MTDNIKICLIKKDKQYDITNIVEVLDPLK